MTDRTVVYRILADASQGIAGVRAFGAEVKRTAVQTTAAGQEQEKFRKGLDTTGRKAGQIGLIAAVGLGAFILKAANFDQAMSNVQAATHETADNMDLLRDAAIDAGRKTVFSAGEAAGAIENLAKAGVSTADILDGGLSGALSLAAAGSLDVGEAAEYTATALTQFRLEGDKATHVADLLAAGAGKAQGEVSDMALALDYAGVPASELGVSIEETAGTIALFAKNGIIGEKAGTGLRGMLASLTSPSVVAKKKLDELGISVFDAQGNFVGLDGVAAQLHDRMGDLTQEERSNALGRIFGNEQLQAANVLYREGAEGVQKWTAEVDDAGYAADTARIKTDNLRGDLERLGGALDSALISGGQGQQGALREITQDLTSVVDHYGDLPPAAQNAATGLLVAGAVAGGSIWAGAKLVRNISEIRDGLAEVAPSGSKARRGFGLATKGLTALTVGLVAYNVAKDAFDIGVSDKDISRMTELIDARFGPDLEAQIEATTKAIAEQKKIADDAVGLSILPFSDAGPEIFPFSQSAADAANKAEGLEEHLADLKQQQEVNEASAEGVAAAQEHMAKASTQAGRSIHYTEEQIKAARDAYQQQREDAAGVAGGFFDISKKADKAKLSLHDWISTLSKQAEALEQFTANVKKAADRGLKDGLIAQLEDMGPTGALRLKQLANASDAEIDRANRAYKRGQKAIEAYVDATTTKPVELKATATLKTSPADRQLALLKRKFLDAEKPVITEVKLDNHQAYAGIRAVKQRLEQLRHFTIDLRVDHQETRLGQSLARGGPVRGPGTSTSDSVPIWGSDGEYMVQAKAVDHYGPAFFDRLNAMSFAQGGLVPGGRSAGAAGPTQVTAVLDRDQVADLIGSGAPFIQHATFTSQGDLERAEHRARRMNGAGGRTAGRR